MITTVPNKRTVVNAVQSQNIHKCHKIHFYLVLKFS